MKKLNIIRDLEEVRIAFELMEGINIAYGTGPCSINSALTAFKKYLITKEEYPDFDPTSVAVIYGRGGIHRYYLKTDGSIKFSIFHMGWKDISKDAESLGFIIN